MIETRRHKVVQGHGGVSQGRWYTCNYVRHEEVTEPDATEGRNQNLPQRVENLVARPSVATLEHWLDAVDYQKHK